MIDTHCHIDFQDFDDIRDDIIKESRLKLSGIINSGTSFEGNKRALELSKKEKDFIFPSLGFHPVSSADFSEDEIQIAKDHIIDNIEDMVAVGEVGMDFFYVKAKSARKRQAEIFKDFAEIAQEHKKPILIHARDCERKALNIIKEYDIPEVVFHCYSGSLKTAKRIIDSNYYMSFSTMICYSNHHQKIIKEIPLEHVLTETDSPYLSPFDGINKPSNVVYVAKKISEIKSIDFNDVEKITENNAKKVFNLKI